MYGVGGGEPTDHNEEDYMVSTLGEVSHISLFRKTSLLVYGWDALVTTHVIYQSSHTLVHYKTVLGDDCRLSKNFSIF